MGHGIVQRHDLRTTEAQGLVIGRQRRQQAPAPILAGQGRHRAQQGRPIVLGHGIVQRHDLRTKEAQGLVIGVKCVQQACAAILAVPSGYPRERIAIGYKRLRQQALIPMRTRCRHALLHPCKALACQIEKSSVEILGLSVEIQRQAEVIFDGPRKGCPQLRNPRQHRVLMLGLIRLSHQLGE